MGVLLEYLNSHQVQLYKTLRLDLYWSHFFQELFFKSLIFEINFYFFSKTLTQIHVLVY